MVQPLDYNSPKPPSAEERQLRSLRWRAGTLAVIATIWGIFCGLFFLMGNPLVPVILFGPGYLVTAGYYWRAFGRPSPGWCHVIWIVSMVVQGCWFCVGLFVLLTEGPENLVILLAVFWWGAAMVISYEALRLEPGQ